MIPLLLALWFIPSLITHAQEVSPKTLIENVFGKNSVMVAVAHCESGLRHLDTNGDVLRGKVDPRDTGLFQINKYWNGKLANQLGLDLEKVEDNIIMAWVILQTQGMDAWKPSKSCWNK